MVHKLYFKKSNEIKKQYEEINRTLCSYGFMQRISLIVFLFSIIWSSNFKTAFEDEGSWYTSTGNFSKLSK